MSLKRTILVLAAVLACGAGCAPEGNRSIEVDGQHRTYRLHLPPQYTAELAWPLVLALHPFTGSGPSMARLTGIDAVANAEGFIAVYPDGVFRSWNYGGEAGRGDDVAFLLALLDAVEEELSVDEARVYVMGASNGASMTYRMLCEAADRFAAGAVVMGGTIPREVADMCASDVPVPLMVIHGTADNILPYAGGEVFAGPGRTIDLLSIGESVAFWRARNGCDESAVTELAPDIDPNDGTTTTITRYETCTSGAPVELYTVEGGGHTWPRGQDNYPALFVGGTSRDFSASEVIWDFFAQHAR